MIVPVETELTATYWAAAQRGQVLLQSCGNCVRVWHPPAPLCPGCRSTSWSWFAASGRGVVRSATRVVHSAHGQVDAAVPYVLVLVELAEGPPFLCGLLDATDGWPADGQAVTIGLGTAAGGQQLPMARLH